MAILGQGRDPRPSSVPAENAAPLALAAAPRTILGAPSCLVYDFTVGRTTDPVDEQAQLERAIEKLSDDLMEARKNLARLRRQRGHTTIENYTLQSPEGPVRLSTLLERDADLLVVHNMGLGCSHCTMWADGFNGVLTHIERRAGFVVVSPDPPDRQLEACQRRGWRFRMLSDSEGRFTRDMGFVREHEGTSGPWPGVSSFRRGPSGEVQRVASMSFCPHDEFCSVWHLFALLDHGVADWQPTLECSSP